MDGEFVLQAGRVESVNTSRGGVPKLPVLQARVGALGLEGDYQRDTRYHGGPERAVVLFSLDVICALQAEGHPIDIGTTGENLTVSGIDWTRVAPGTELTVGDDLRMQITKYASPCRNIRRSFKGSNFMRISQEAHPGWSRLCARVTMEGMVRVGDPVRIVASQ
jgi:MOSC domain-containing protein YiiM